MINRVTAAVLTAVTNGPYHQSTEQVVEQLEGALKFFKNLKTAEDEAEAAREKSEEAAYYKQYPITHYVRFSGERKWHTAYKRDDSYFIHDHDTWYAAEDVE